MVCLGLRFEFFPLKPLRLILCPERQSMQIALFVPTVRKMKNHRHSLHKLIFILLFLLTFSAVFNQCLSVIFQFLLSSSRVVFSHISSLRIVHIKLRRSFVLSQSDVNRLPRFAVTTLYRLRGRQSLVAGFMFLLVFTGWIASLPQSKSTSDFDSSLKEGAKLTILSA